jgi:hypothetical protein
LASKRKRRRRNTNAPTTVTRDTNTTVDDTDDEEKKPSKISVPSVGTSAKTSEIEDELADADDLDAVHREAMERYEAGWEKDRDNQARAFEDLRFLSEEDAQWDARALSERRTANRPILTVNKCPQFVRQVTGDIRQLRPAIHVVPIDENATDQVAVDVLPEMVRYIERRSDAKGAYFNAADQMVAAGIGHARIYSEYAAATTTMNQELAIGLMPDGISVVWDPDSIELTRKDALYCFVPIDMTRKRAEKRWDGKAFEAPLTSTSEAFSGWATDDHVRVTEYWRKCPYKRELAVYADGRVVDLTDDTYEDKTKDLEDDDELIDAKPAKPLDLGGPKRADAMAAGAEIETRDSYRVERFIVSGTEVLEGPEYWPGMHIPIVPFIGEEVKIGREVIRRGVVRALKDVQRLYNYAISADAEVIALQPKAPYKGTRKNFENYLDQWETANSKNWPFLEYDPDPENGGRPPEREPPPLASTGIRDLLNTATGDMSAVTGIYPASLGQQGNESSGKAITARQREGDTGTYLYVEAFGRAIERIGVIVVDLIPHIYDTQRTLRVTGDDGKATKLEINKVMIDPNGDGIDTITFNDVTTGVYDVTVEMGPSFSTKREEARDGMQTMMQALGPQVAPLLADLYAKGQDFPLAKEIGERLKFLLPPQIAAAEAAKSGEQPPPPPPPPPPNPEQQLQAQELKFKAEDGKAKHELSIAEINLKRDQIKAELVKVDVELEKARMSHQETMAGHAAKVATTHMDAVSGEADRIHEGHMARMNGGTNGSGKPSLPAMSPEDDQQQQQIDALVDAVARLQQAVVHIADTIGGGNEGAPPPPDIPPGAGGPPPPPIDMGPPPGAGGPPPDMPPPAPGFNQSSPPGISGPL